MKIILLAVLAAAFIAFGYCVVDHIGRFMDENFRTRRDAPAPDSQPAAPAAAHARAIVRDAGPEPRADRKRVRIRVRRAGGPDVAGR